MKDWHKSLLVIFCPLLVILFFVVQENKKTEVSHKATRSIASLPAASQTVNKLDKAPARKIAAVKLPKKRAINLINRIPQSIEDSFQKNKKIKLSSGFEFIDNIAASPIDSFDPSLGSVVKKDGSFVYFRTNPGHAHIPVAISRSTKLLYPISSVLHVKGATPEMRSRLLNKGFEEYYYHAPLKFLSLKSQSGEVVKVYSRLQKEGYKVELEVLRPDPQTF